MEKFILNAGKVLARIRSSINYFLEDKLQGNPSHIFYFLMALFILYILLISAVFGFTVLIENALAFMVMVLLLAIILLWLAIRHESDKHLQKDRHPFNIAPIKNSKIRYDLLDLDEDSQKEFNKLLQGRNVQTPINFTIGNKSGESANHRILFVLFDEVLAGGIQEFSGDRKKLFFQLLINSFLMNGESLKGNTLKSSFSSWKNDQEKINSKNQRELVKRMLGKQ
ncbi:hypothetical protein [Gillisia sp. JM1]|uniref:hypothetical protein n=1 Tax=Gillisia sp. JM1 TaxID=1283286 RepID=UPI00040BDDE9|nr:hypothetical protein [Gillisia sp. JM1]